ncbi:MAG: 3-deoxy-manno-octulosonate cytidylyltransferase [Glaciecola sp.]|jgi:3-deoxy-manno-octulosonate cytidylyltransferase (CMP-KDO synthetase)
MQFIVVIPARFGSTRFPGKPLVDIAGKPMIQHVVERAQQAQASTVVVATDDQRILNTVEAFGGQAIMTRDDHESGTERLAEVVNLLSLPDDTIVVNVQGDEPHIPVSIITQVAQNLAVNPQADMATLACEIKDKTTLFNPNVVKVVRDRFGMALTFSRSVLPFDRNEMLLGERSKTPEEVDFTKLTATYLRHIGIYAYRAGFIKQYVAMEASPLEQIESLEQLRVLFHGGKIHVDVALATPPPGIDTPEDLAKLS